MNTMYRMAASAAPGVAVELGHDPDRDDYRHDVLRSGAAPTPLYHQYQESFGLTPFTVTIIFAAGVLSLLMAPLTVRLHRPPRGPNCPWYRRTGESLSRPSCLHQQ
jgi:hypothetical protein